MPDTDQGENRLRILAGIDFIPGTYQEVHWMDTALASGLAELLN
jgi:hypothetical protein